MIRDLTTGNPKRILFRYTLPLLGSVIFQQLYNIADSFVAGKFIGESALAAVGNAYEVTLVYLAFATGCNIGCSVIISQLFGAGRYKDLKTAVSTTFLSCGALCACLMLLGFLGIPTLLTWMKTPADIYADCLLYLRIYTGGLGFLFLYNIANGIFSALGDSRTPFLFLAASSVANIFINILFVAGFNMGVSGVAWATFLCQGVSCVLAVGTLFFRLRALPTEGSYPLFSRSLLKKLAVVSVPSILQQSFVSVGNVFIQGIVNSFASTSVTAGYTAAVKLQNFATSTLYTYGNGMSAFTAQNIGAKKPERIPRGLRVSLGYGVAVGLIFTGSYLLFGRQILSLFMQEESVVAMDVALQFLTVIAPFYFLAAAKLSFDGVLRGAGDMNAFMIDTFTDLLLRVVLAACLSRVLGVLGIWLAWPLGWVVATTLAFLFYRSGRWKHKSKV